MAALGRAVVIVEGAQPWGTVTADLAAKLGRTVGAVPGQVGVRVAAGTNDLIKDGAHLIRDARDVLDLLFGVGVAHQRARLERAPPPRPGPAIEARLRGVLDLVGSGSATVDRLAADAGGPRGTRRWPWRASSGSATSPRTRPAPTRQPG